MAFKLSHSDDLYRGGERYRPVEEGRDRDRDRGRDYQGNRGRDGDRGPSRREPDRRDSRDSREMDRKEREKAEQLRVNTNVPPSGPRNTAKDYYTSSKDSPLSSGSAPSRQTSVSSALTLTQNSIFTIPKMKDPRAQEFVDKLHEPIEILIRRERVYQERQKKKLVMAERNKEMIVYKGEGDQYSSAIKILQKTRERDELEFKDIDLRSKALEKEYTQRIEELATLFLSQSNFTSQPTPSVVANPSISALETKFEEFQKSFTQSQEKITQLETDRQNDKDKIKQLQKRCEDLESTVQDMRTQCSQLEKAKTQSNGEISRIERQHDILGKDIDSVCTDIKGMHSDYTILKEQFERIEPKIATLQDKASLADLGVLENTIKTMEQRITGLTGRQDDIQELRSWTGEQQKNLASRIQHTEEKVSGVVKDFATFKEQVEPEQVEKVVDHWITQISKMPEKVRKIESRLSAIEGVKKEGPVETKSYVTVEQTKPPGEDWGKELASLRSNVAQLKDDMKKTLITPETISKQVSQDISQKISTWAMNMFQKMRTDLDDTMTKLNDEMGNLIDVLARRIDKLESNHTQGSSRTPAPTPQLEARILSLENARNSPAATADQDVEARVGLLVENTINQRFVELDSRNVQSINGIQQELQALKHATEVLSTLYNNITTADTAQRMIGIIESHCMRHEKRLKALEVKQEHAIEDLGRVEAMLVALPGPSDRKRPGSPSASDNLSKKLRLNGASPAQPLQNGHNGNT